MTLLERVRGLVPQLTTNLIWKEINDNAYRLEDRFNRKLGAIQFDLSDDKQNVYLVYRPNRGLFPGIQGINRVLLDTTSEQAALTMLNSFCQAIEALHVEV